MGSILSVFFSLLITLLVSSMFISYYFLLRNKNLDSFLKILYGFLYSLFILISISFLSSIRNEVHYLYHDKSEILQRIEYLKNNKKYELIFESIETNSTNKVIRMRYREKDSESFIINLLLGDIYRIIYNNNKLIWIQSREGFYCVELELGIILINESKGTYFINQKNNELWIVEWNPKENSSYSGLQFKKYDISKPAILLTNKNLSNQYPLINEPIKEYKINYKNEVYSEDKVYKEIESIEIETKSGDKFRILFND
jgi:hypothetical protein